MPGKRTGEGGEGTNDRRALNKHLFLRGHHFIDIGDSSARARANFRGRTHLGSSDRMDASDSRGTKRAKFDIDGQREASAKAKTAYYLRYDTYLLATEFERRA